MCICNKSTVKSTFTVSVSSVFQNEMKVSALTFFTKTFLIHLTRVADFNLLF